MSKDIFISYSRGDQEFVTRLASDVDAQVAVGTLRVQGADTQCQEIGFGDCSGQIIRSALGDFIGTVILVLLVFMLFVIAAWLAVTSAALRL